MSSIRSILIRTCMTNIQKEFSQLEHWLNNLSDTNSPKNVNNSYDEHIELSTINRSIEKLNDEVSNQRLTLNNILERIDNLEGFKRPDREVFIDENVENNDNSTDSWLNNCDELINTVINNENMIEQIYNYNTPVTDTVSVGTPSIIPDIPEDKSILPDIDSDDELHTNPEKLELLSTPFAVDTQEEKDKEVEVEVEATEKDMDATEEELKKDNMTEEEEEEVEEEVEEEEEEEEVEEEEEEEVEVEEEEVEVEEEEGKEFEEIEYNNNRYYKDEENFIYSVDLDDQPSENPIGYWKEKTKTIAFYKTK